MGISTKNLVFLSIIFVMLFSPAVFASEYNYSQYRPNNTIQNDFSNYMANLRQKIQRNWNPPDFIEKGDATIIFKINRYGEILSSDFVTKSGNNLFDESTLEALRKSAPFDKFPTNSTRDSLTIKYDFHSTMVKTDTMEEYIKKSDHFFNVNNKISLDYINLAIDEVGGDIASYFLYGKRSKIKRALGDIKGAEEDLAESKRLKAKFDKKRINTCKLIAEMDKSPFAYFYLANSYEIAGDYASAIEAIDKAIELTDLNNQYKRYREELINKNRL